DPNWNEGGQRVEECSRLLYEHVLRGGTVLVGLNGAVLLNITTASRGLAIHVGLECPHTPPGYNASKYLCVARPFWAEAMFLQDTRTPIYVARIGAGSLVILPYNVVWAYADTRDPRYLLVAREALEEALRLGAGSPRRPGAAARIAAYSVSIAASLGAAVAASWSMGRSNGQARRLRTPLVALRRRIGLEEAAGHPVRREILRYLERHGYAYFNELWRWAGLSKATLAWHLYILERHGYLGRLRWRGKLYVYLRAPRAAGGLARHLALRGDVFCRAVKALREGLPAPRAATILGLDEREVKALYEFVSSYGGEAYRICGCAS
ncbi:MAG: helix-turn-helix transcriptional regulator, partial [Candidatus Korarchaeota archaeon]|nr:helix-turn-helix transcriptional regulator [Candidatus Korarchaeota archaeon]